jgi:hypothetical protein
MVIEASPLRIQPASKRVASLSSLEPEASSERPEYIRLPPQGELEFYSGLSKATLERILKLPGSPVKSIVVAQPGTPGRGCRLILLSSLLSYLSALPVRPPESRVQPKRQSAPRKRKAPK